MENAVIVVRSFGNRAIGTLITDEADLAKVAASEHVNHVVRVALPRPPATPTAKKTGG